jgi:hypothetical protein
MAVDVVVFVELWAMGLSGRSIDSDSCSTGDKTVERSKSFLVTRSMSDGRVTSLGRNPSMQLSRLKWGTCSMSSAAHVETDVELPHRPPSQPVLIPTGLLETDHFFIINYLIMIPCYSLHDLEIRRFSIPVVRYSSQIPL